MRAGALSGVQQARAGRCRGREMDCRPSQTHEPKGEVMTGNLLLVLLIATGLGQADKKPGAEHAAAAAKTQVKKEAVKGQKGTPAKTKAAQEETTDAQAETKNEEPQGDAAQVKTEAG